MAAPEAEEAPSIRPQATAPNESGPTRIEPEQVREQLERILSSPSFRNSRRNSNLLKHVVEAVLVGNGKDLRERAIGTAVFGRAADYDTGSDHIVRSVAGEVRRRLAQYYVESQPEAPIRIELLPGSYVPQFRPAPEKNGSPLPGNENQPAADVSSMLEKTAHSSGRRVVFFVIAGVAVALLAAGIRLTNTSVTERLWGPLWGSAEPVLLCVGGSRASDIAPPRTVIDFARHPSQLMHTNDAIVLASITALLKENGKSYRILNRASKTSFRDLQSGPFVLIGGLNNEWALRLTQNFRFSLITTPEGAFVVDREAPANKSWHVDPNAPVENLKRDYAVISRFRDSETERTALVIAAIGPWSMLAAGEFLTNSDFLKKIENVAVAHWSGKNLQLVIATDVIHGSSGPPKILAAHFW